ncbi:hypothetical protein PLICRDRAFT_39099 [Plicaturopsis crispa FD-325 SS-3]|nr:hypothetical protein PLICRDRAFT_39099 [Plicaturopsis crispa FD-325 SS-3]
MCQRVAEGTRWLKCGHFQRHDIVLIKDCFSTRCSKSIQHPKGCQDRACIPDWGPQIERSIHTPDEFCVNCRWKMGLIPPFGMP